MKMARDHGPLGYRSGKPEDPYYEARPAPPGRRHIARVGGVVLLAAAAGLAGVEVVRRRVN
jgi:hypothetical protein